jgi:hypothetical protein
VPYFPLGGFSPLQSDVLESVAKRLGATPTAVAQSGLHPVLRVETGTATERPTLCTTAANRHSRPACSSPSRAVAKAGRNQHVHGCPREIGSAVLRSRESP